MPPLDPSRRGPARIVEVQAPERPHTPVPEPDTFPTEPPPRPMPMGPPRGLQGPRGRLRSSDLLDADEGEQDSMVTAADTLAAELAKRSAELAQAKRQLELSQHQPVVAYGTSEKRVRRAQMHSAVLKVMLALAGLLGAGTTYLAVHSATVLPPRVESAEVRTKVVETASDADHAALLALREYLRAEQARRECLDAQMSSALARYTGHRVSGPADGVAWIESSMPTRRPALLWDRAVWFPATPCSAETRLP